MPDTRISNGANVRSSSYFIARAIRPCWRCSDPTPVLALALPPGHDLLEIDADAVSEALAVDTWEAAELGAFLFYVEYLPAAVQARVRQLSQLYRRDYSRTTDSSYWMNHCRRCRALQGDHYLHCEPDGAFMPGTAAAAAAIVLMEIREPFEASAAGYAYEPDYFDVMRRIRIG
jgi:hypothetical protein